MQRLRRLKKSAPGKLPFTKEPCTWIYNLQIVSQSLELQPFHDQSALCFQQAGLSLDGLGT